MDSTTTTNKSPEVECVDCKPGDATHHPTAVKRTGCEDLYAKVDSCMGYHKGRVSACTREWRAFRECHDQKK